MKLPGSAGWCFVLIKPTCVFGHLCPCLSWHSTIRPSYFSTVMNLDEYHNISPFLFTRKKSLSWSRSHYLLTSPSASTQLSFPPSFVPHFFLFSVLLISKCWSYLLSYCIFIRYFNMLFLILYLKYEENEFQSVSMACPRLGGTWMWCLTKIKSKHLSPHAQAPCTSKTSLTF